MTREVDSLLSSLTYVSSVSTGENLEHGLSKVSNRTQMIVYLCCHYGIVNRENRRSGEIVLPEWLRKLTDTERTKKKPFYTYTTFYLISALIILFIIVSFQEEELESNLDVDAHMRIQTSSGESDEEIEEIEEVVEEAPEEDEESEEEIEEEIIEEEIVEEEVTETEWVPPIESGEISSQDETQSVPASNSSTTGGDGTSGESRPSSPPVSNTGESTGNGTSTETENDSSGRSPSQEEQQSEIPEEPDNSERPSEPDSSENTTDSNDPVEENEEDLPENDLEDDDVNNEDQEREN